MNKNNLAPSHIGFIMDGNRRWAKAKGLLTLEGHRRGYNKLKEVGEWCLNAGVKTLTVYAFSTENWNRSEEEVNYLMNLLEKALSEEIAEFTKKGIQLRVVGSRDRLKASLILAIEKAENETRNNEEGILYIAINYGGQQEIIDATKKIIKDNINPEELNREVFKKYLYAPEASFPDLIIRTSGEQRLSGFLLWQSEYSELYFVEKHWPDFSEQDLSTAIDWFSSRHRRRGK